MKSSVVGTGGTDGTDGTDGTGGTGDDDDVGGKMRLAVMEAKNQLLLAQNKYHQSLAALQHYYKFTPSRPPLTSAFGSQPSSYSSGSTRAFEAGDQVLVFYDYMVRPATIVAPSNPSLKGSWRVQFNGTSTSVDITEPNLEYVAPTHNVLPSAATTSSSSAAADTDSIDSLSSIKTVAQLSPPLSPPLKPRQLETPTKTKPPTPCDSATMDTVDDDDDSLESLNGNSGF